MRLLIRFAGSRLRVYALGPLYEKPTFGQVGGR